MARRITTAKRPKKRSKIVRYASLARIPIRPLSRKLIEMSDEDVERRAALDPDAGRIPRGFWEKGTVHFPGEKWRFTPAKRKRR